MDERSIQPLSSVDATVTVPGSKSLTQRALIAAALADGTCLLRGPLDSEDTRYTAAALRAFGIAVAQDDPDCWQVRGRAGGITPPAGEIYLGNNGTATRFLTSVAALAHGRVTITGDERMAQRPIGPLMTALQGWGVRIESIRNTGCPPLAIEGQGIDGGPTVLPEGKSSQYLSSLLLVAPYARRPASLEVRGRVYSKPYVRMTLAVMAAFGIEVEAAEDLTRFAIPQGCYRAIEYAVEGDASSASYFWAAAAVTGGRVTVANVPSPSLQGDAALVDAFERMGCRVERSAAGITVAGTGVLRGIEVDMADCPDVAPTLAVVAALAEGRTVIRNVAHLRIKECDRLRVVAEGLAACGVTVEEREDALLIDGCGGDTSRLHGARIATHDDHRMAMAFAVLGLAVPGVRIENPACVAKSFPDFWERFALLGA